MQDISCSGVGSIDAGEYGKISVSGVGKCTGAIYAQELRVSGVFKSPASVRADAIKVSGSFKCEERLDSGKMSVSGAVNVEGDAGVEELRVDGSFKAAGRRLEVGRLDVSGVVKAEGDLGAGHLAVSGSLKVEGELLECSDIQNSGIISTPGQISTDKLYSTGIIKAREIVGDEIVIRVENRFAMNFGHLFQIETNIRKSFSSRAELIEATTIEIESVAATTVNGTNITVGPGCVIENLDCNGTLHIDAGAEVKNITGEYTMV